MSEGVQRTAGPSDGPRVAVVGMGRMGAAMAVRLSEAGVDVVVYNRTPAKAAKVASRTGATAADTARHAAACADIVAVSLADDAAVRATYEGRDGLVAGLRPGAVVVETSTIDPETVHAVGPWVEERGAALLDAPVSGSVPLVQRGELTVMVGGPKEAFERVRPILDVLARAVFHLGGWGTGAAMKLSVNAAVHALNQALCEALVLAERAGIPREAAYEVFAASAVAAPFVHYKRTAFERPREAPPAFTLDLVAKDLDLIARLAARVGAPMHQAATNSRVVRDAIAAGRGGQDLSAIAEFLRDTPPAAGNAHR